VSSERGNRFTSIAALVLLAAGVALSVVIVFRSTGETVDRSAAPQPTPPARPAQPGPIVATATLDTPVVLFGDTLVAHVDVVVDRTAVDPDSVVVVWNSTPWVGIEPPRRALKQAGSTGYVRTTYVLRCLAAVCAPARETERVYFAPARITYAEASGPQARTDLALRVPWRPLVVHSRIGDAEPATGAGVASPWRVNLTDLPAASTYVRPGFEVVGLGVIGVLLLTLAGLVLYRAWPRREPELALEPEPEPEPIASALEQALMWLERVDDDGTSERRRALELVADEVERVGDRELALRARALAWSDTVPEVERTRDLASLLRVRLASVLDLEAASSNGDGPERKQNGAS
jgi:hypothetical protein